jgi:hypothetical protein
VGLADTWNPLIATFQNAIAVQQNDLEIFFKIPQATAAFPQATAHNSFFKSHDLTKQGISYIPLYTS